MPQVSRIVPQDTSIEVSEGRLHIERWSSDEPDLVRLFDAIDDPDDRIALFGRVAHTGALALSAVGPAMDLHTVDREFDKLSARLEGILDEQLGLVGRLLDRIFSDESGDLRAALDRYLGDGGSLADMFDPDRRSSAVGRLNQALDEHIGGPGSKLYQLLDHTDPTSPISDWHDELVTRFDDLKRQLENYRVEANAHLAAETAAAAEREKGTAKGRDFEQTVFDAADAIAKTLGDTVESVGNVPGLGCSKVGDFVVTINPRDAGGAELRIVLEAKDRSVGLSPMLRELDSAIENRDSRAGIAIYSHEEYAPRGAAPFRAHGNRYLCVLDKAEPWDSAALELAYRAARYWAIAELSADGAAVDAEAIAADLTAATTKLKTFADLKRQVTKLHKAVDDGADGLTRSIDALHSDLRQIFDRLNEKVEGGATRSAA
jgi:hypothetical protein